QRRQRAHDLLASLGLAARRRYKPGQLSGGQQQRVSIARALMNGGEVILADEPTGALDTQSGQEVLAILEELHTNGHTIIIVTHDMAVARHAQRLIEISDGEIIADRANPDAPAPPAQQTYQAVRPASAAPVRAAMARAREATRMALLAMNAHRLRTCLTMLGIIIGIASVVAVVALGNGTREQILANIASLGTNTIQVYPGRDFGDLRSGRVHSLKPDDAIALAQQSFIDSATPEVSTSVTARNGNDAATARVEGVGAQYFRVKGMKLLTGTFFDADAVRRLAQVAIIDADTRDALFPAGGNPLGQVVVLDNMPVRIIGVVENPSRGFGRGSSLRVWTPYSIVMWRLLGQDYVSSITVRVSNGVAMNAAEQAVKRLLLRRHGSQDFFLRDTAEIREAIESTTRTMALLISSIAAIALLVGGIGVMNIMLVSVAERTREIGVRMA